MISHHLPPMASTSLHLPLLRPTSSIPTLESLAGHLSVGNFRQADAESRRLLISLAGDAAEKRGYVFFSEVQFIGASDLRAIDDLWQRHSSGRFGYAAQRRVWDRARRDFTKFFVGVGWMRRLDTPVEQFGYRAFPEDFIWELGDDTPEGHLPLTNALRGTRLLATILDHPAFVTPPEEKEDDLKEDELNCHSGLIMPDYSF